MKIKKVISILIVFVFLFTLLPAKISVNAANITVKVVASGLKYDSIGDFREGFAVAEKDNKFGFIGKTGKEIVPCIYDSAYPFSEGLGIVIKSGKNGYVDKTGKIIIPLIYDFAGSFIEGLAVVAKNGKTGYIDKTGKEIVPCIYDSARDFSVGLGVVWKDNKWGLVNEKGELVSPPEYDYDPHDFLYTFDGEGLAIVRKGNKFGYIDKTGKLTIPCIYDNADFFSEGLANVTKDGKVSFIDATGNEILKFKEYDRAGIFINGLAVVGKNWRQYGLINKSGEEVLPCIYEELKPFSEGLAGATLNGKAGFINITGKEVIPFIYEGVSQFINGSAVVRKDRYGLIDKTGKELAPCIYDDISLYDGDELAGVKKGDKYGYISVKTGGEIVPCIYDNPLIRFSADLQGARKNGKWGLIDKTGREVVPFIYDKVDDFDSGMNIAWVYKDGKYGFIDRAGNVVVTFVYDDVDYFNSDGLMRVARNGKYGFIDKTGKEVVTCIYDYPLGDFFINGLLSVHKGGKYGYIDKTGKEVVACVYDGASDFTGGLALAKKDGRYSILEITPPKIGAPIGDILYSNITAYINDKAIPTSVIDGKTLVVVEDLAKYGFDVTWNNSDRSLKVERKEGKKFEPLTVIKDTEHKPGTFKQKYVYTDIKTYLSGEVVESYSVNGSTLIDFELLKRYGKLAWDGQTREIRLVMPDKFTVFWGQTGNRIHIDPNCRSFSLAINAGTLDEARAAGRDGWCSICSNGWSDERFLKEGNPNAQKYYDNIEKYKK